MDVGQYLAGLDARGQLPRPEHPLRARVGYHQPCHLRALDVGTPGPRPDPQDPRARRRVHRPRLLGDGRHLRPRPATTSAPRSAPAAALLSRLRDDDIEIGATECGACRMQMEQGVTKRTLHPIKLLSLGYGLNPSLRQSSGGAGVASRGVLSPEHPRSRVDHAAANRYLARRSSRRSHVSSRSTSTPRLRHATSLRHPLKNGRESPPTRSRSGEGRRVPARAVGAGGAGRPLRTGGRSRAWPGKASLSGRESESWEEPWQVISRPSAARGLC